MGFKNKLENAYYEIVAPEKQELISDANKLDLKINDLTPLQKAINNLKEKINKSQTWKQREILEKQLKELEKLYELYLNYKNIKVTQKTKQKLEELFKWISSQISLKQEQINDDYKKIEKIINKEKNILKDTIDIFSYNTIRDMVEDNIDIIWTYESIPPQKYQEFFDIITITYIDFLEEKLNRKLTKQDEEFLIKNKWFFLTKEQASYFIKNLINKLNKKFSKIKFFINLKKESYKERVKVDLEKFSKIFYKKQETQNHPIKLENIRNKKEIINNYDNLTTREKLKYIEQILEKPENKELMLTVIYKLKNKIITIEWKKIKLTDSFIIKNKENLINNLKNIILMIIHIESDWKYKAKNLEKSSWKWLGQWLDWNWKYSIEYMYNKKWYTKNQIKRILNINKIKTLKKRTIRKTSSFETTLKQIYNLYSNNILKKLSFEIPNYYNKKLKLSPLNLNLEQQIQLLILDIWANNKKVKNKLWQQVWIKDYLWTAILWNSWAVKEIYKIFHHTRPNKETLYRIKKISPIYLKKLIKLW